MRFLKELKNKTWAGYAASGCIIVAFYVLLTHLSPVLSGVGAFLGFFWPVFLSLIISYVMNPLVGFFERRLSKGIKSSKISQSLSVFISFVLVIAAVAVIMVGLIPQIAGSIVTLISNMGGYISSLQELISSAPSDREIFGINISSITGLGDTVLSEVEGFLTTNASGIIGASVNIGQSFVTFIISMILSIYILVDKENIMGAIRRFLGLVMSEKTYHNASEFWRRCHHILIRYMVYDIVDGIVIGVINFVFMLIMRMPYAVIVSLTVGITNLAPTFGPLVGAAVGAFILVLVNPWQALFFIVFTIILQTFDGYIFKPKLFGDTFGVSSVLILAAIITGGRMFGVVGILFAIPAAAILDFIYRDYVCIKLRERRELISKETVSKESVSKEPKDGEDPSDNDS